jgi:hypothetical protein
MEIRAVVNQIGVAMELHGHKDEPVTLDLIRYHELGLFRSQLAESNPDMQHATIGQLAVMYARRIYKNIAINPRPWTYNASENTYS